MLETEDSGANDTGKYLAVDSIEKLLLFYLTEKLRCKLDDIV